MPGNDMSMSMREPETPEATPCDDLEGVPDVQLREP